jgi:hypothetical protein
MNGGTYAYVRDGKRYKGGILGDGIEKAVQGNRQAEEYAQEYKTGMATGLVLTLVGAATAIGGLVLLASDAAHTSFNQPVAPTGLIVAGGGLVVELIGDIIMLNAQPHLFDAINAYNDGLLEPSNDPPAP